MPTVELQNVNTKKINLEYSLILVLAVSLAMFQASEGLNIPILSYLGAMIIIFYCLISDNNKVLYVLMFIMPINKLISFYGISLNLIILILYCFKVAIINKFQLNRQFIFWGVMLIFYMLSYCLRYNSFSELLQAIKIFFMLYFCLVYFQKDQLNFLNIYRNAILYLSIGLIINYMLAILFNAEVLDERRFALSDDSNQNSLGIVCAYAIAQIAVLWNNKNISRFNGSYILFIGICVIGISTQSRSFLLSLGIVLLWILFSFGEEKLLKKVKNIFFVGVVLLSAYMIIIYSKSEFSDTLQSGIDRIISPKNEDITNGRFLIWDYYLHYLKDHLYVFFFGVGDDYTRIGIERLAHNAWLEMITAYGLVGVVLLVSYYVSSLKYIANNTLKNYNFRGMFNMLPLLVVFACGMFSHSFLSLNNTLQIFLGAVVLFSNPSRETLDINA